MLEDVERIEVISGPGATLWGANAVNGVINVITRPARDTQGALWCRRRRQRADRRAGALRRQARRRRPLPRLRQGLRSCENTRARQRRRGAPTAGTGARPASAPTGGGPRRASRCRATPTRAGRRPRPPSSGRPIGRIETSGANLLGRWTRQLDDGSDLQRAGLLRPHRARGPAGSVRPRSTSSTSSSSTAFRSARTGILWGGGYRHARDEVAAGHVLRPDTVAAQPQPRLGERVRAGRDRAEPSVELTLGVKVEQQRLHRRGVPAERCGSPGRLSRAHPAVGRAVARGARAGAARPRHRSCRQRRRSPSPAGRTSSPRSPTCSSSATAAQPSRALTYSVTAFRHDWDRLRSGQAGAGARREHDRGRHLRRRGAGARGRRLPAWRLSAGGLTLRKHLRLEPGSTDPVGPSALGNDPEYQWMLRSSLNVAADQEFDVSVRRVGSAAESERAGLHRGRPALWVAGAPRPRALGHAAEPARPRASRVRRCARAQRDTARALPEGAMGPLIALLLLVTALMAPTVAARRCEYS